MTDIELKRRLAAKLPDDLLMTREHGLCWRRLEYPVLENEMTHAVDKRVKSLSRKVTGYSGESELSLYVLTLGMLMGSFDLVVTASWQQKAITLVKTGSL